MLQVFGVVRLVEGLQALTVERVFGSAGVEGEVDAGIVQHLHGFIVVTGVVNSVDTNSVDSKLFEHLNVGRERFSVEERVLGISSSTGLVCNTTNEETLVSSHEGIAINGDLNKMSVLIACPHKSGRSYRLKAATLALLHASESARYERSRREGGCESRLHDAVWRDCQVGITNVVVIKGQTIRKVGD